VLLSFVIPEIALAIGLLFLVTTLATPFTLGTTAQLIGLITFQLSYPVVIVRARLLTIGTQYEEAARDLGATALGAVRRVLLPMLTPAIMVSSILVFADVLDNFVIVRYLSADMSTETTSMRIYNTARAAPTPALNALATLILVTCLIVIVVGWLLYRRWSKGQGEDGGLGSFTGTL
jgi:spermidine/putrescine transport system permease protein